MTRRIVQWIRKQVGGSKQIDPPEIPTRREKVNIDVLAEHEKEIVRLLNNGLVTNIARAIETGDRDDLLRAQGVNSLIFLVKDMFEERRMRIKNAKKRSELISRYGENGTGEKITDY